MDLRPTSNAAATAKIGNPEDCFPIYEMGSNNALYEINAFYAFYAIYALYAFYEMNEIYEFYEINALYAFNEFYEINASRDSFRGGRRADLGPLRSRQ